MKYLKWRLSVFVLFVSVAPAGVKAFVPSDSDLQRRKDELVPAPEAQSPSQNVPAPTEFERVHGTLKPAPAKSEAFQ